MSRSDSNPRRQTSTTQGYKIWSQGMKNVLFPEMNVYQNSSTLTVYVPINIFMKLGFVSVNGPTETYFLDAWRPPWCFSRRAGYEPAPGFTFSLPFIIIPHKTITLHKQLLLQSPQPQLSPVHYTDIHPTRNVVCPSGA